MTDPYADLKALAIRCRKHMVRMVAEVASGHLGSSLSATEMGIALYWKEMRHRPDDPGWPDRDRFCLSKGHASPFLYTMLAESGYFPVQDLLTFRKVDSHLQGHPAQHKLPGVEISAGSLGQGLSQAVGMALAGKLDGKDYRVYCMVGDGELQEGQIWEAAMFAPHRGLDNLCVLVDFNGFQIDGPVGQINDPGPIVDKFRGFRWHVTEVDGHNFGQIFGALDWARGNRGRPSCIVAHTRKGKGLKVIEDTDKAHSYYPKPDELPAIYAELEAGIPDSGHIRREA